MKKGKTKYSHLTVRALKKMSRSLSDIQAQRSPQKDSRIHVSFQVNGITVNNSWSIDEINKMATIKKK